MRLKVAFDRCLSSSASGTSGQKAKHRAPARHAKKGPLHGVGAGLGHVVANRRVSRARAACRRSASRGRERRAWEGAVCPNRGKAGGGPLTRPVFVFEAPALVAGFMIRRMGEGGSQEARLSSSRSGQNTTGANRKKTNWWCLMTESAFIGAGDQM